MFSSSFPLDQIGEIGWRRLQKKSLEWRETGGWDRRRIGVRRRRRRRRRIDLTAFPSFPFATKKEERKRNKSSKRKLSSISTSFFPSLSPSQQANSLLRERIGVGGEWRDQEKVKRRISPPLIFWLSFVFFFLFSGDRELRLFQLIFFPNAHVGRPWWWLEKEKNFPGEKERKSFAPLSPVFLNAESGGGGWAKKSLRYLEKRSVCVWREKTPLRAAPSISTSERRRKIELPKSSKTPSFPEMPCHMKEHSFFISFWCEQICQIGDNGEENPFPHCVPPSPFSFPSES